MCKHCKTINLKADGSERSNECKSITRIKDGSQEIEVYLNRYACDTDNVHMNQLVLDWSINVNNEHFVTVKEKIVKIKYCPFCGEEL